MNESYDDNRQNLLKNFILKLILIILFVLLLVWLIPKSSNKAYPDMDISAIKEQVFSENIEMMKDAATNYFTKERLPKNIGDSVTLTLQEMYDNNLLTELKDKNGKSCAIHDSYVRLTKEDNEYLMKVNLKCEEEEDYILVHMGCYNYCTSSICEKESNVSSYIDNYVSSGKGGNNSNRSNSASTLSGKTITKKKTTIRKKTTYMSIITTIKKTITKVTTDVTTDNTIDPDDPTNPQEYLYEYAKKTSTTTYKWGPWSSWQSYVDKDGISEVTCDEKDFTCLKEVQTKKEFEQVGTYTKYYKREREESQQLSSYTAKYCKNYNYVVYENTIYYTTSSTSGYNSTSSDSWVKSGSVTTYTNPPADSPTVRYVLVGADYDDCNNTCTTTPKFKYQKYVYKYNLSKGGTYTSSTNSKLEVTCAEETTKTIPVYANVKVYDVVERQEPAYAYVKYYRTRIRTLDTSNSEDIKWSYYNDRSLLDNGYTYTGRKKEK